MNNKMVALVGVAVFAFAANAVDFYWTGGAGDGNWSTVDNWATDAQGTPAEAAPTRSQKASLHFVVPGEGLVVTQNVTTGMIISNLVVTTSATDPVEFKIVSPEKNAYLDFCGNAAVSVESGVTCTLNVSPTSDWTNDLYKDGPGILAFDYVFRSPAVARPLKIREGRVVVLATSLDPRLYVTMSGVDPNNPPVLENRLDGGRYGYLWPSGLGSVQLNGITMGVGDESDRVTVPCVIPPVTDGGTLAFFNERVAILAESEPKYDLELDRADVNYNPVTVVSLAFDDEDDPFKDTAGFGSRFVPVGNLAVVNDATRGKVLSLDGESYFKGPDADAGFAEFNPGSGFTISFWFKPDSDCNKDARMFLFGEPSNDKAVSMRLLSSATVSGIGERYNINYGIWGNNRLRPEAYVWDGNWHHFVATHDGKDNPASFSLYFDGQLVGSMTPNIAYAPPNKNFFFGRVYSNGASWNDGSYPYKGLLDDLLVLNRPLSDQEIQGVYANGLPPAEDGDALSLKNVTASSAGVLSSGESVSVKTLSGAALAGGVELKKAGSTLTVGTGAGATATTFDGKISGHGATLAKTGADYMLTLDGSVEGVDKVAVNEGTLHLRRPCARRGLVCHYSFDDPADFGYDDGPGGVHLMKIDTGTPTAVDGVRGKAVHFGGTENPVVLGSGAHPRPTIFPRGNDSFTVSVWIRPTAAACTGQTCVFVWGKGATGKCSLLRFDSANSFYWHFNGKPYELQATCPTALGNGEWHHIVATYDGTTRVKTFYCDGAQVSTMTIDSSAVVDIDPTWRLELGRYAQSDLQKDRRYEGDMDEFMLFDYAWTAEEVSAEYNGTGAPTNVAATASLPTPVARWTFDGENPLADTTGNAALTLSEASTNDTFNVTYVTGDAICGKAAKFAPKNGSGFLKLATFPEGIIPSGNTNFTVVARYRPDYSQVKDGALSVVGWGEASGYTAGKLFRIGPWPDGYQSARFINGKGNGIYRENTFCSSLGNDRTRWYTVAVVYQPSVNGNAGVYGLYVDGEFVTTGGNAGYNLPAESFAIGASYTGTKAFSGLVDDIQVYDCMLSDGQIRMIAEQFEAAKGKATTDAPVPAGVLRGNPDVTVASGATLKVASDEIVGSLSGSGTVEIAPFGRLNVSGVSSFSGTLAGKGLVGFADNSVLEFGDGSQSLLEIDRPLAIGKNVTVNTTVRAGRLLIARASSFVDTENLESWTATVNGRRCRFVVSGGTDLYMVVSAGMAIILR